MTPRPFAVVTGGSSGIGTEAPATQQQSSIANKASRCSVTGWLSYWRRFTHQFRGGFHA